MTRRDLGSDEYNHCYQPYIDRVGDTDIMGILKGNHTSVMSFIKSIDERKLCSRYSEDKWSIREIILHLIDTERVFAYRALCIARNDKTNLPSFDQDAFVAHSHGDKRSIDNLLSEYESVRAATISLFDSFDKKALTEIGIASNTPLSVRAVAFIIVGHENHHLQIIRERYL